MKNKAQTLINFVVSIFVTFISTNVYWLLTVTYTKPVKVYGEEGVLTGYAAAKLLISKYGVSAYLSGLSLYFMVVLVCCILAWMFLAKNNSKHFVLKCIGLSILGAALYYFLDFKLYVSNKLSGITTEISGKAAINEVGYQWLFISVLALALLLFATVLLNIYLCKSFSVGRRD